MRHRAHLSAAERSARSKLARIAHGESILCGSLVRMKKQCGNPNCKCARGERHESLCLSIRVDGKRKMIHVPRHLEGTVIESVEGYQRMKMLMDQVSQSSLERFIAAKEQGMTGRSRKQG
jgi:hypothetical protein